MHDEHTRRLARAMSVSLFKKVLAGVANGICRQAVDRKVRYREALQALETILSPKRFVDVHIAIEELYLPEFRRNPSYAGKNDEDLRQIARFSIIADFEDFFRACLRQDFPDLFADALRLLGKVPSLKATEFTRQEHLFSERNPLAYLWAIVIGYTKGTPLEDSLGYKKVVGKLPHNAAHMHRARQFIRTLGVEDGQFAIQETLHATDADRKTDEPSSHSITLVLDDETWQKLVRFVERYEGKQTIESAAATLLRSIINRIANGKPT